MTILDKINLLLGRRHTGNIILTGLPRAGTTLTIQILCAQENLIALNEPIRWKGAKNRKHALSVVDDSFLSFRRSLSSKGVAPARVKNGMITDNHFDRTMGKRERVVAREEVHFKKELNENFKLVIKHNSVFTLLLDELAKRYPVYAIIRNPLATLGSWNSVSVPVSKGNMRHLTTLNPNLAEKLGKTKDTIDRQLIILDFYFQQYHSLLSDDKIIKYEDMISSNGASLAVITNDDIRLDSELTSKNVSSIYDAARMAELGKRLLESEGDYWQFYSRKSIEDLLSKYKERT